MKQIIIIAIIAILLGIAYYTLSPIFRTVEINDELPPNVVDTSETNIENESPEVEPTPMPSGVEDMDEEVKAEFDEAMAEAADVEEDPMDDPMPEDNMPEDTEEEETPAAPSEPVVQVATQVMGTVGHPASGMVRVLETTTGSIIRYEDFSTINGPRLHVYLAKDLEANDYVDLGPIKGTSGNINYEVPADIDLSEYQYVMYWCVPFGVLFNYAELR